MTCPGPVAVDARPRWGAEREVPSSMVYAVYAIMNINHRNQMKWDEIRWWNQEKWQLNQIYGCPEVKDVCFSIDLSASQQIIDAVYVYMPTVVMIQNDPWSPAISSAESPACSYRSMFSYFCESSVLDGAVQWRSISIFGLKHLQFWLFNLHRLISIRYSPSHLSIIDILFWPQQTTSFGWFLSPFVIFCGHIFPSTLKFATWNHIFLMLKPYIAASHLPLRPRLPLPCSW